MFEMKQEYYLGVDAMDAEHIKLFEIAEGAYQLLTDEFITDKFDYIVKIIQELKEYTEVHFADEEAYMESIQYKKLFSHKIEHHEFIEKLNQIDWNEVEKDQEKTILNLLEFLNQWLINHILYTDKLYVSI
ncbi:MAG: hemerythrin family protein [Lachnospiraceae bacterium]|nr:hemerythrin family protein [Lachnospiraceae bacterium]MDD3659761.1 hemerythrin family protein [Lachnospiraceae bacterium]